MIQQLRTYEIFDHNKAAFHRRFEEHAWRIMRNHGFDVLAFWESAESDMTTFMYLLSWPDHATKDAAWEAFMADEEWKAIKVESKLEHGQLVGSIREHTLIPTSYSPLLVD